MRSVSNYNMSLFLKDGVVTKPYSMQWCYMKRAIDGRDKV